MLDELAIKYGTDKSSLAHNYANVYEKLFSNIRLDVITLCEIGVFNGASVRMWKEYFQNGWIFGIDTNKDCYRYKEDHLDIIISNATDPLIINLLPKKLDIIIDDGSHDPNDQIKSFGILYPLLKENGYYIIEDIYIQHSGFLFYNYQLSLLPVIYMGNNNMCITFYNTFTIIQKLSKEFYTQ